ncbi:early transcribed membrane protein [Plasmodium gaboni]|uniref:Early transcribed membrane protein n=1 Tax=Plasmodium gaboni TaxID=647221 RepID=A0A151L2B0_9APIC|nr:early transcribed membrane protein [Plasmodium gaboni]KYN93091.1 early transcribed membrane protein [Plasmodium gaboni]SOV25479.1 early transcribed membrane protein 14.2 [Plasmodium sp. DRC-Itaito]
MKVIKVYFFLFIMVIIGLLGWGNVCNELKEKKNMLLKESPDKLLSEKRKKKLVYSVIGTLSALLGIAIFGMGINSHFKEKKKTIWDEVGKDMDSILNRTIAVGIWKTRKNCKSEIQDIEKIIPSQEEIQNVLIHQIENKNIKITDGYMKEIQSLSKYVLYNIRNSMKQYTKTLSYYS